MIHPKDAEYILNDIARRHGVDRSELSITSGSSGSFTAIVKLEGFEYRDFPAMSTPEVKETVEA